MSNYWDQTEIKSTLIYRKSSTPTKRQKQISQHMNEVFNRQDVFPDDLKRIGYSRVNFDADLKGRSIIIKKAYLIRESGDVEIVPLKNKFPLYGNSLVQKLKQRGLAMSINIPLPSFLVLFHQEIVSTFKDGALFKLGFATVLGTLLAVADVSTGTLVSGLFFLIIMALMDGILGYMPNTKTEKDLPKDHSAYAKFLKFVTSLIAIIGLISIHGVLVSFVPDPNFIQFVPVNIHYFGGTFILGSYGYSIFRYLAIAHNAKNPMPAGIVKYFSKDKENNE